MTLSSTAGHTAPTFKMSQDQFLIATKIVSLNHTVFPNPDLSTYIQVVWLQTTADTIHPTSYKWYNSTSCNNTVHDANALSVDQY